MLETLARKAFQAFCPVLSEKLYKLWGKKENDSEEKWREIFRLLFADKDNSERFRQGFSQMLAVQHDDKVDHILKTELTKVASELSRTRLFEKLEEFLRQGQWRTSDEETVWIFYQLMILEEFNGFEKLCEHFPCQELKEIDSLWVKYSNGQFGFSVQKEIWKNVGGTSSFSMVQRRLERNFVDYADQVKWWKRHYDKTALHSEERKPVEGEFPARWVTFSFGSKYRTKNQK